MNMENGILFTPDFCKKAGSFNIEKANTIPQWTNLAAAIAARLESHMVLTNQNVITINGAKDFKEKSDTIKIRIPKYTSFVEHNPSGNDAIDFEEGYRDVKLDKLFTGDHSFTAFEMTQALESGQGEVVRTLADGALRKLEDYMMETISKRSVGWAGDAGSTPDAYADVVNTAAMLDQNEAPMDGRTLIVNHDAASKLLIQSEWKDLSQVGDTLGLKNASLGQRAGMNIYKSSYVKSFAGAFSKVNETMALTITASNNSVLADGTPYSVGAFTEGGTSSTAVLTEGATGYFTTAAGVRHYFTVLETTGASTSGVTPAAKIFCTPRVTANQSAVVAVFADKNKNASVRNLAIQKDCVILASRPIHPLPGLPTMIFNVGGIPMRLYMYTDGKKKETKYVMDFLCKAQVLRMEGVTALLG